MVEEKINLLNDNNVKTVNGKENDGIEDSKEDEKNDDEGLLLKYDVIICGTGLLQSILACALARAGKKVLHCDAQDYYGEYDSVWTLDQLQEKWDKQQEQEQEKKKTIVNNKLLPGDGKTINESNKLHLELSPTGSCHSLKFHSMETKTMFPIQIGSEVRTPYGIGIVLSLPNNNSSLDNDEESNKDNDLNNRRVAVQLCNWKLSTDKSPVVYFGTPLSKDIKDSNNDNISMYLLNKEKVLTTKTYETQLLFNIPRNKNSFALDLSPSLVYASGSAVNGLLTSNVSDHLEFKTIDALYWLPPSSTASKQQQKLQRVPCSKSDIFQNQLLKPMDKRRFMKFLQLAMDYANVLLNTTTNNNTEINYNNTDRTETDNSKGQKNDDDNKQDTSTTTLVDENVVQSLNERHLNQGRSLSRPQNKAFNTKDIEVLQQFINKEKQGTSDIDFDKYLIQQYRLSDELRSLIRYCLALEEEETSNQYRSNGESLSIHTGMNNLCRHLHALGHYGTTGFLTPLYGSGELSQFFCRSAAVYGATYLLRRPPLQLIFDKNEIDIDSKSANFSHDFHGVLIGGGEEEVKEIRSTSDIKKAKIIRSSHVIITKDAISLSSSSSLPTSSSQKYQQRRVFRRISIIRGKLITKHDQRAVIIIPPNNNIIKNQNPIHGIVLDGSVHVTPSSYGVPSCSILHLSTILNDDIPDNDSNTDNDDRKCVHDICLAKALEVILESFKDNDNHHQFDEIYHTSFSYNNRESNNYDDSTETNNDLHSILSTDNNKNLKGLHIVNHRPDNSNGSSSSSTSSLTADWAFDKAKQIFTSICPGYQFLALSKEMDNTIKEQFQDQGILQNDDDDDERYMLQSAMDMIDDKKKSQQESSPVTPTTTPL